MIRTTLHNKLIGETINVVMLDNIEYTGKLISINENTCVLKHSNGLTSAINGEFVQAIMIL